MSKSEINQINSWDVKIEDLTPVMQQYMQIKRQNPGTVLLYRLGDFYETFFEDAVLLSKELELTLTGRDAGAVYGRVPLAGIPFKAINGYLEKLVQKNIRVALCDQLEDPKFAKGLVKRGVTRIITSGTLTESDFLKQNTNNYIAAMFKDDKSELYGFAYSDISTGEFKVTQAPLNLLMSELARIAPAEIVAPAVRGEIKPFQIVPEERADLPDVIVKTYNCSKIPASVFDFSMSDSNLKAVFTPASLTAFGYDKCKLGFRAAGALLAYVWESMKENVPKIERIEAYELSEYMILDAGTRKNLELVETMREKNKYGSLLWAIDQTKTNMGARLLRNWICQPLKRVHDIMVRQRAVSELVEQSSIRVSLIEVLEKIYDIQRLSTRLSNNSANPKDFLSLKASLEMLPELIEISSSLENNPFASVKDYEEEIKAYTELIARTIKEDAPMVIKEGGIINEGVSGELDYYRDLLTNGEEWLINFAEREREKTGIKTLKVGENKVFGYFIEITNTYRNMIPENYVQ